MLSGREGFREPGTALSGRRISRGRFLRMAGLGAGISLLPASYTAFGGANEVPAATLGLPTILGRGEFPIGIWWPPPPAQTTAGRYRQISGAGFNFVIGGNGVTDGVTNPAALQAAASNGLRFVLTDRELHQTIRDGAAGTMSAQDAETPSVMRYLAEYGEPERTFRAAPGTESGPLLDPEQQVRSRVRQLLELYAGRPALAGLNLFDEPGRTMYGLLGAARRTMRTLAPRELPYVNLAPAAPRASGAAAYERNLAGYLGEVRPPMLCFDHYPLLAGTKITPHYFYNWAVIRRYALRFGIPSWVFIQSMDFDGRRVGLLPRRRPSEREILWQVNVSLAYGAKGIQYFTYWTPDVPPGAPVQFGRALVSAAGETTPSYQYARRVNGYLRVIGRVLLPLISESVVHARERDLPRGTKVFRKDGFVTAVGGSPAILGRFRRPGLQNARHLLVANRSFSRPADTRLVLPDRVGRISRLDIGAGRFVKASPKRTKKGRELRVRLAPGAARLFLLRAR